MRAIVIVHARAGSGLFASSHPIDGMRTVMAWCVVPVSAVWIFQVFVEKDVFAADENGQKRTIRTFLQTGAKISAQRISSIQLYYRLVAVVSCFSFGVLLGSWLCCSLVAHIEEVRFYVMK
jgi:hypothetical protein